MFSNLTFFGEYLMEEYLDRSSETANFIVFSECGENVALGKHEGIIFGRLIFLT